MDKETMKEALEIILATKPNWDEDEPKCPGCWRESTPIQLKRHGVCKTCLRKRG